MNAAHKLVLIRTRLGQPEDLGAWIFLARNESKKIN